MRIEMKHIFTCLMLTLFSNLVAAQTFKDTFLLKSNILTLRFKKKIVLMDSTKGNYYGYFKRKYGSFTAIQIKNNKKNGYFLKKKGNWTTIKFYCRDTQTYFSLRYWKNKCIDSIFYSGGIIDGVKCALNKRNIPNLHTFDNRVNWRETYYNGQRNGFSYVVQRNIYKKFVNSKVELDVKFFISGKPDASFVAVPNTNNKFEFFDFMTFPPNPEDTFTRNEWLKRWLPRMESENIVFQKQIELEIIRLKSIMRFDPIDFKKLHSELNSK